MKLADFLGGISQHLGKSLVCLTHFAVLIEDNYAVAGLFDQDTPSGGFVRQCLLSPLEFGYVQEAFDKILLSANSYGLHTLNNRNTLTTGIYEYAFRIVHSLPQVSYGTFAL